MSWADLSAEAGPLRIARETERVFRDRGVFVAHLRAAGGRPPPVDFERRQVLLISPGPRSSTGYVVEVTEVRERDGNLEVTIRERTPGLEERIEPRVTFPYRLLSLPAGKNVYVEWKDR